MRSRVTSFLGSSEPVTFPVPSRLRGALEFTPTAEVCRDRVSALSVETSVQIPENAGIFRQSPSAHERRA